MLEGYIAKDILYAPCHVSSRHIWIKFQSHPGHIDHSHSSIDHNEDTMLVPPTLYSQLVCPSSVSTQLIKRYILHTNTMVDLNVSTWTHEEEILYEVIM